MSHEELAGHIPEITGWFEYDPDDGLPPYRFYGVANKAIALIMPGIDIHVYVKPLYRHNGIGTKLLEIVLEEYPNNPWTGFRSK